VLAGQIAITFDDAPMSDSAVFSGTERTQKIIKKLKEAGVKQTLFYCNTGRIHTKQEKDRLLAYANAGHLLGNHTHSHSSIQKLGVDNYIAGIETAEKTLSGFPNFIKVFRYPFLDRGKTKSVRNQIKKSLANMGYIDGYVTVDNYDYYLDILLKAAVKAGRKVNYNKLKQLYTSMLWESILFYDKIAVKTLGASPKHVLLLHENDLTALFIDDLVRHIRQQGWEIISPMDAYNEPLLSKIPDTLKNNQGRVVANAVVKGYKGATRTDYENEKYLDEVVKKKQIFQ